MRRKGMIVQMKTEQPKKKINRGNLLKLIRLMLPYRAAFAFCLLLTVVVNAAEVFKPVIMEIVIDDFLRYGKEQHGLYSIQGMGVVYFLLMSFGALAALGHTRLITRISQKILHDMRCKVFSHISRMNLTAFDEYSSGRLLTRATSDTDAINEFYVDVIVNLFKDIVLLIGVTTVMLVMNWKLALVGFAAVPFIALLSISTKRIMKRNFQRMKKLIGHINAFFSENIDGMKTVQAFNREDEKNEEFLELNNNYFKNAVVQIRMHSVLRPLMEVVNNMAIALLLVYGCNGMVGGWLEVGVVYAFTTYIKKFFEPINDLADKYNTIQSAAVSAERIFEILDDTNALENTEVNEKRGEIKGHIEFDHVWFSYDGETDVLRDVSFEIRPGERVAFIGPTGAGKTTIINLISGFYTPQKGEIRIDGIPIKDWNLGELREHICVVLQEVFLFAGTIEENIALTDKISREDVEKAVELAAAAQFVARQPEGLQTQTAERGATFSAGERQLLSFARAIAHKPSILVLDEATANIDSNTEQVIQRSIAQISKGRTTVFIAHRLSTIRQCDCIYVVSGGQIAEKGNHAQLMQQGGIYAEWCGRKTAETVS